MHSTTKSTVNTKYVRNGEIADTDTMILEKRKVCLYSPATDSTVRAWNT